jgi:hypothetical protein
VSQKIDRPPISCQLKRALTSGQLMVLGKGEKAG